MAYSFYNRYGLISATLEEKSVFHRAFRLLFFMGRNKGMQRKLMQPVSEGGNYFVERGKAGDKFHERFCGRKSFDGLFLGRVQKKSAFAKDSDKR